MNAFVSLAYLLTPAGVILAVTLFCGISLSRKAFWAGVACGLSAIAAAATLVYFQWSNPEGPGYHQSAVLSVAAPVILVAAIVLLAMRLFKVKFSRPSYLGGYFYSLASAACSMGLLCAHFTG